MPEMNHQTDTRFLELVVDLEIAAYKEGNIAVSNPRLLARMRKQTAAAKQTLLDHFVDVNKKVLNSTPLEQVQLGSELNVSDKLLDDMRCTVSFTDVATMPIPLYEMMKAHIAAMQKATEKEPA
jgi:hypothetical protein